jgi:hypothetical protein
VAFYFGKIQEVIVKDERLENIIELNIDDWRRDDKKTFGDPTLSYCGNRASLAQSLATAILASYVRREDVEICTRCDGKRWIETILPSLRAMECPICHGKGWLDKTMGGDTKKQKEGE